MYGYNILTTSYVLAPVLSVSLLQYCQLSKKRAIVAACAANIMTSFYWKQYKYYNVAELDNGSNRKL